MARKYSRKREAILRVLRATDKHPSAEQVFAELKSELPNLSLGTVYRNISIFRDEGEIASVAVVNGQERFDGNTAEHAHFICRVCGAVNDIHDEPEPSSLSKVSQQYGIAVERRRVTYFGRCEDCAE